MKGLPRISEGSYAKSEVLRSRNEVPDIEMKTGTSLVFREGMMMA